MEKEIERLISCYNDIVKESQLETNKIKSDKSKYVAWVFHTTRMATYQDVIIDLEELLKN